MITALGVLLVAVAAAPGVGAGLLVWYLDRHRGQPGAGWFMWSLAAVAAFCLSYAASLLVFDPALRAGFELVTLVAVTCIGPPFLVFGLEYTGRSAVRRQPLFWTVFAVPAVTALLAVAPGGRAFLWTGFRVVPLAGTATVRYTLQPWGTFAALFSLGTAGVGVLLLVDAILSYGPLYRQELAAVVLSTVPPSVGGLVWLFQLGPVPQLNLAVLLMSLHVALDAYAFVGTHMFATSPTTRRVAERSALDALTDPLLVVDPQGEVVHLSDRAEAVFGVAAPGDLPVPLDRLVGRSADQLREADEVQPAGPGGDIYAVSYTELTQPGGDAVGGLVVLYDVTAARQRQQQLAVLNRILRHNLRNELTAIRGNAQVIESELAGSALAAQAEMVGDASDRLLAISEKVRAFVRLQERSVEPTTVAVDALLDELAEYAAAEHPDAAVTVCDEATTRRFETAREPLWMALKALVENAVVHADGSATVTVSARDGEDAVCFEVRDTNDPIPDTETEALEAGTETQLSHGQGVGLWIADSCVRMADGQLRFAYDEGNVVTVLLRPSL